MTELVRITFTVELPAEVVEGIVGQPDDGSDEYYEKAGPKIERAVGDDPMNFLDYSVGEEVEIIS